MSIDVTLTRRRVLGIIITIGLASAAVGVGTFAVFSDTESTTDNTIEAGSLDLTIDGTDQEVQMLNVSGAVPGDRNGTEITLRNNGSVNGQFNVSLSNSTSSENSYLDPEVEAGDNTSSHGELDENIYVTVTVSSGASENQTLSNWQNTPSPSQLSEVPLAAGNTKNVTVEYFIPEQTGNVIQSDSVTADFEFTLTS